MKELLTPKEHPELLQSGQLCKVLLPSEWIGAYDALHNGERVVWLPGKITEISWGKNDVFKKERTYPAVCIEIRPSKKYNTVGMKNLQVLPTQVEDCIRFRANYKKK